MDGDFMIVFCNVIRWYSIIFTILFLVFSVYQIQQAKTKKERNSYLINILLIFPIFVACVI